MYGYIYKTTNLFNDKIYIGQHRASKFDPYYYGSGVILSNIINKYGTHNLVCELVEECDSEDQLNKRETYWISYYNSTDYSIGYNLASGGYKTRGVKHHERTKKKISESKKGCHPNRDYTDISEETKKKISDTLKEYYKSHKNPRYGATLSEETKAKLRQANLGKKQSEETKAKHRGRPAWNKGIPMTEEAKQHLREVNLGKKHSEEAKQKMRGRPAWNKGISMKEESKEKLRQANLGKKLSEETIAKRSATIQERNRLGIYSYKRSGRIWVSNGSVRKQILPEELDSYVIQGYHRGWK
jgi:group I intron endonuclease